MPALLLDERIQYTYSNQILRTLNQLRCFVNYA